MSVIHRIKLPANDNWRNVVGSDLGEWQCCANEEHSFYEPMVSLSIQINADHTLQMFCEADQVDAVVAMLREMLSDSLASADDDDDHPSLSAAERNPSLR